MTRLEQMRIEVLVRDGGCVAPRIDPDAGPCYDEWGYVLTVRAHPSMNDLEADYVRHGATGARHVLAGDHVALCAGHHRGAGPTAGYVWATAHRADLRDYLNRVTGRVREDAAE